MSISTIPANMAIHFAAAKSSRLMTVTNMEAKSGWLLTHMVGDWLRICQKPNGEKSDIGVIVFSFYREFDYYANGLLPMGINLREHEAKGHLRFFGSLFGSLFGDVDNPDQPPTTTLDAALELLCDEAAKLRQEYGRTVLLFDSPEIVVPLVCRNPREAVPPWLVFVQTAASQFDHTIVALALTAPQLGRTLEEFEMTMACIHSVRAIAHHADVQYMLRDYYEAGSDVDGTIQITYGDDYVPPDHDLPFGDDGLVYSIQPDGHTVRVGESYCC